MNAHSKSHSNQHQVDTTERGQARPWTIWLAYIAISVEALGLVIATVFSVVLGITVGTETGTLLSLSAMFGVLALVLIGILVALYRVRRWARPASVAWQILLLVSGLSMLGSNMGIALSVLAPAVCALFGIFAPASLVWYDGRVLAQESQESR